MELHNPLEAQLVHRLVAGRHKFSGVHPFQTHSTLHGGKQAKKYLQVNKQEINTTAVGNVLQYQFIQKTHLCIVRARVEHRINVLYIFGIVTAFALR